MDPHLSILNHGLHLMMILLIVSPITNVPVTEATSKTFVVEFQVLTLAVALLVPPVTVSLKIKSPLPLDSGSSIVTEIGRSPVV